MALPDGLKPEIIVDPAIGEDHPAGQAGVPWIAC